MNQPPASTPTITITSEGVKAGHPPELAQIALSDFQSLDRALSFYDASQNSLINASAELLSVCGTLTRLSPQNEINSTRMELARIIIDLKYRVVQLDYPASVAENLCLLYAIVLDEFILARNWGPDSGWENRTLVADLFGFRDGGDRFYNIADRALMQPKVLQEFLEIIYIFLKLGYRGKFNRPTDHDRDRLINRLETSLGLLPSETDTAKAAPVGRPLRHSEPPAKIMPLKHKLLLTALSILLIIVTTFAYHTQRHQSLLSRFQTQRADAESRKPMDLVFDSTTNTLEEVPRQ